MNSPATSLPALVQSHFHVQSHPKPGWPLDVMIFAGFYLFISKSQAPTHSTSLNHDMFPHSLSYLISCPISFILSFIFFRSFWSQGKLGHLGLLGLKTFGPEEDAYRTIYFGAMSNCSPTKESTQVVTMELILSWTSSQVNSVSGRTSAVT